MARSSPRYEVTREEVIRPWLARQGLTWPLDLAEEVHGPGVGAPLPRFEDSWLFIGLGGKGADPVKNQGDSARG